MAGAFKKGDFVAVGHEFAVYAAGAILRPEAIPEGTPTGVVVDTANDEKTWYDVDLDDGDVATFTQDELVKVAGE